MYTLVQDCNFWQRLECAGVLVACAAVCAFGEIDEPDCIECMGDLYDTCKDCFNTLEATEKQAGKLEEVHSLHVAIPNKVHYYACFRKTRKYYLMPSYRLTHLVFTSQLSSIASNESLVVLQ